MAKAELGSSMQLLDRLLQDENMDQQLALESWKIYETLRLQHLAVMGDLSQYSGTDRTVTG